MHPYHFPRFPRHEPEHSASVLYALLYPFKRWMSPRVRNWHEGLLDPVTPSSHEVRALRDGSDIMLDTHFLPHEAMTCMNPACGCSAGKGDLPPVREIVVTGPPVTRELELVFGVFGKPVAVVLHDDGVPHVFYEDGTELAFHPIAVA